MLTREASRAKSLSAVTNGGDQCSQDIVVCRLLFICPTLASPSSGTEPQKFLYRFPFPASSSIQLLKSRAPSPLLQALWPRPLAPSQCCHPLAATSSQFPFLGETPWVKQEPPC